MPVKTMIIKEPYWKNRTVGFQPSWCEEAEGVIVEITHKNSIGQRSFPHRLYASTELILSSPMSRHAGVRMHNVPIRELEIFDENISG